MAPLPNPLSGTMLQDLMLIKELVYEPCGRSCTNLKTEPESKQYGACTFLLNELSIRHRVSKITPTKAGQFVAIWKRGLTGSTEPFYSADQMDLLVITVRSGKNLGQFIFPKSLLLAKGVISGGGKAGKRGIRIYPPWDHTTSQQARATQKWQSLYFMHVHAEDPSNMERTRARFLELVHGDIPV